MPLDTLANNADQVVLLDKTLYSPSALSVLKEKTTCACKPKGHENLLPVSK
jgi:hypothetical protein